MGAELLQPDGQVLEGFAGAMPFGIEIGIIIRKLEPAFTLIVPDGFIGWRWLTVLFGLIGKPAARVFKLLFQAQCFI